MTAFSSIGTIVSAPILRRLLRTGNDYSKWQLGNISAADFYARNQDLPEGKDCYHASLVEGPWKKPGYCTSDLSVNRRVFPVLPETFLKQLGIDRVPKQITMTRLLLAALISVANETVYRQWPDVTSDKSHCL